MRRIEFFSRNLCHDTDIEEQILEAQRSGIITSYRLTTLTAMNARRDANLCLWCDEIWYANHIHSCSYAPDYNCMFTCGKEFEVFAFVKVSKRGLEHLPMKELREEVHVCCADKVFDEMSRNEFEVGERVKEENGQGAIHQVFNNISNLNFCPSQVQKVEIDAAHDVFDNLPIPDIILEMAQAAKIAQGAQIPPPQHTEMAFMEASGICIEDVSNEQIQCDSNTTISSIIMHESGAKQYGENGDNVLSLLVTGSNENEVPIVANNVLSADETNEKQDHDVVTLDKKVEYRRREKVGRSLPRKAKATNASDNIVLGDPYMLIQQEMTWYNHLIQTVDNAQWKSFDPGIHVIKLVKWPNVTLEDKGVFRGEEEKVNAVYTRELCNVVMLECKCMSLHYCVFDSCVDFGIRSERFRTLGSIFLSYLSVSLASLILALFSMSGPIFQLIDLPYNNLNVPLKSAGKNNQKAKRLCAVMPLLYLAHHHLGYWLLVTIIGVAHICVSEDTEDALLKHLGVKQTAGTNHGFLSVRKLKCLAYCVDSPIMIILADYVNMTKGYTYNCYEDVTPKQDMSWHKWFFISINIQMVHSPPLFLILAEKGSK